MSLWPGPSTMSMKWISDLPRACSPVALSSRGNHFSSAVKLHSSYSSISEALPSVSILWLSRWSLLGCFHQWFRQRMVWIFYVLGQSLCSWYSFRLLNLFLACQSSGPYLRACLFSSDCWGVYHLMVCLAMERSGTQEGLSKKTCLSFACSKSFD